VAVVAFLSNIFLGGRGFFRRIKQTPTIFFR
jgi:hypothetical protein